MTHFVFTASPTSAQLVSALRETDLDPDTLAMFLGYLSLDQMKLAIVQLFIAEADIDRQTKSEVPIEREAIKVLGLAKATVEFLIAVAGGERRADSAEQMRRLSLATLETARAIVEMDVDVCPEDAGQDGFVSPVVEQAIHATMRCCPEFDC